MTTYNIILVRPKYPRNIGMVSRAMCNFGLNRLILIDPQCELDQQASQGAAQGQSPLRHCTIYNSWESYAQTEADGPRVAFSRREGKRRTVHSVGEIAAWPAFNDGRRVSLVFGAEDHGLSREDLLWAHRTCALDIPGPLKSMNLSHAVLLAISQLPRPADTAQQTSNPMEEKDQLAPTESIEHTLKHWLQALNFDLSKKHWNAYFAMRKMLFKAAPTESEQRLFSSIVNQTVHRLKSTTENQPSKNDANR